MARATNSASSRESGDWSSTLLSRPSGGIAESISARQVSWLAAYRRRRLPRPMKKSSGEKSVGTPLTVAGAATDRQKSLPCSLFTLGRNRRTVRRSCSSFRRGCQMERVKLSRPARPEDWAAHGAEARWTDGSSSEKSPARASAGNSSSGLGGEPRGPNNVLSSHSAVSLASPATRRRVRTVFSGSVERCSSPNSVSANRRSISCCNRASASRVAGHAEITREEPQNLALTCMRFEARTTAGAQTATETKPRRNRRRGTIREPILRIPGACG